MVYTSFTIGRTLRVFGFLKTHRTDDLEREKTRDARHVLPFIMY